ncbi:hypothetical protein ACHAQA_008026 [Verticillium albo-atrum]
MPERVTSRRVFRRTDAFKEGVAKVELVTESLPSELPANSILIKVAAVSLNYRDANIVNGGNPWPVIPKGIPGSDAAGTVIAIGSSVKKLSLGDNVVPILDQENISGREKGRRWLVADVDGVLGDYIILDEELVVKTPAYLDPREACTLPCSVLTAWNALQGISIGKTVLIQGTGGVSLGAIKIARAAGCRVILTSSSDSKLKLMQERFGGDSLLTIKYATNKDWHDEALRLTNGEGVDLLLENGGSSSIVQSIKCTKRGGTISQVGYLAKDDGGSLAGLIPGLIDRRINLRGINGGSKHELEDLCVAVEATKMRFHDTIDSVFPFEQSEEAIEHVWQGKQVGKVIIEL